MVSLLVTVDLEVAPDHDLASQSEILDTLRRDLASIGAPATFFTTSDAADAFPEPLQRLAAAGHEIACHGLTHGKDEDYGSVTFEEVRSLLHPATANIEKVAGTRPRTFRGPRMTTSPETHRALLELGYVADFSICPQRLDLATCRSGNTGWITSPRVPYHPSVRSPYTRGALPLLVVPLSCIGLPFLSGLIYLFGLPATKLLFRLLLAESRRAGNPVVYLFHSYEFCAYTGAGNGSRPLHHRLYRKDPAVRYARNMALLRHMLSREGVRPMTGKAFVEQWCGDRRDAIPSIQVADPNAG
jgi:hypothetical protein